MTYRGNRRPCGLRLTAFWLLAGVTMSSMALAQQTVGGARAVTSVPVDVPATAKPVGDANRPGNSVSLEEMTAIIKRLEERVKELEANVIKAGAAPLQPPSKRSAKTLSRRREEAGRETKRRNNVLLSKH